MLFKKTPPAPPSAVTLAASDALIPRGSHQLAPAPGPWLRPRTRAAASGRGAARRVTPASSLTPRPPPPPTPGRTQVTRGRCRVDGEAWAAVRSARALLHALPAFGEPLRDRVPRLRKSHPPCHAAGAPPSPLSRKKRFHRESPSLRWPPRRLVGAWGPPRGFPAWVLVWEPQTCADSAALHGLCPSPAPARVRGGPALAGWLLGPVEGLPLGAQQWSGLRTWALTTSGTGVLPERPAGNEGARAPGQSPFQ